MLDDEPLTIDWTVQNTLLQILPRPPLLSSHEQGWNGINVECHRQPAHETPEHFHTQHVLAIVSNCNLLKAERKLDGHFYSSCMDIGGIFLIPANVHHQVWMHGEAEYILLSLKPELITRAAYESIDKDCVEIVPQHHIHDSLIYSIGLALLSELKSDGVYNRLYAESAASLLAVHLLQRYSIQKPTIRKYKDGLTKSSLQQAVEYINDHLGEDLSLKEIANQVSMSQYHFGVCILALWLMWRRSAEPEVGVRVAALIPIIFWGAFFYTTILIPGTSLKATADEFVPSLAGFPLYPNVIVASINVVLSALGYWLYRSGTTSVTNQSEVTNSSESMRG